MSKPSNLAYREKAFIRAITEFILTKAEH